MPFGHCHNMAAERRSCCYKCAISRIQRLQHPGLVTGGYCFLVVGYECIRMERLLG